MCTTHCMHNIIIYMYDIYIVCFIIKYEIAGGLYMHMYMNMINIPIAYLCLTYIHEHVITNRLTALLNSHIIYGPWFLAAVYIHLLNMIMVSFCALYVNLHTHNTIYQLDQHHIYLATHYSTLLLTVQLGFFPPPHSTPSPK